MILGKLPQTLVVSGIIAMALHGSANAQRPTPRRTAAPEIHPFVGYFEVIGAGGLYSLNLERLVAPATYLRFGATAWSMTNVEAVTTGETAALFGIARLIDLSPLLGQPNRWAEVGAVLVAGTASEHRASPSDTSGALLALSGDFGIRYQPSRRGWMFRLTATPFYTFQSVTKLQPKGFSPSAGGSIGWVF